MQRKIIDGEHGMMLTCFDAGEWGGSLWWFSKDGKRYYKISSAQIVQFLQINDGLYAIDCSVHMGLNRGTVLRIKRQKTRNGMPVKWLNLKILQERYFLGITVFSLSLEIMQCYCNITGK